MGRRQRLINPIFLENDFMISDEVLTPVEQALVRAFVSALVAERRPKVQTTPPVSAPTPPVLSSKLLLRPIEICDALGVSRTKAYELIASGTIPSVRLGRSIRVPVEAIRS